MKNLLWKLHCCSVLTIFEWWFNHALCTGILLIHKLSINILWNSKYHYNILFFINCSLHEPLINKFISIIHMYMHAYDYYILVTLKGSQSFKGFMILALPENDASGSPVGSFVVDGSHTQPLCTNVSFCWDVSQTALLKCKAIQAILCTINIV